VIEKEEGRQRGCRSGTFTGGGEIITTGISRGNCRRVQKTSSGGEKVGRGRATGKHGSGRADLSGITPWKFAKLEVGRAARSFFLATPGVEPVPCKTEVLRGGGPLTSFSGYLTAEVRDPGKFLFIGKKKSSEKKVHRRREAKHWGEAK